jgi:hypothetical protein
MAGIFKSGGTYEVTAGRTYSPVVLVNTTFEDDGYSVTLDNTFSAGTTFEVSNGGFLDLAGIASPSLLASFDIGNTGTLEIGSGVNLAIASPFTFTNTAGTSAELIFSYGTNISLLTAGISGFKQGSEIDLTGQTITGTDWDQATGLLTVTTTTGTETLAFQGTYTTSDSPILDRTSCSRASPMARSSTHRTGRSLSKPWQQAIRSASHRVPCDR